MLIRNIDTITNGITRCTNFGKYKGYHICFDTWKKGSETLTRRCVTWNDKEQRIFYRLDKGWIA